MYSNCCCSCLFEAEIIKIGQSSHNLYSNNILNIQESTAILNACTKNVWKLIETATYIHLYECKQMIDFKLLLLHSNARNHFTVGKQMINSKKNYFSWTEIPETILL